MATAHPGPHELQTSEAEVKIDSIMITGHESKLLSNLLLLKDEESLTDVTLATKDGGKIKCHKLVLSAASPYFKMMFTTGLKETNAASVPFPTIDTETMTNIVNFIYTSRVNMTVDNVCSLVEACHLLDIVDIVDRGWKFMLETMTIENCLEFRKTGKLLDAKQIIRNTEIFILGRFEAFYKSDSFNLMSEDELIFFLNDDRLTASEQVVFEALVKWTSNKEDGIKCMTELLATVRFEHMNATYLCDQVQYHDLILKHQTDLRKVMTHKFTNKQCEGMRSARVGIWEDRFVLHRNKALCYIDPKNMSKIVKIKCQIPIECEAKYCRWTVFGHLIFVTGAGNDHRACMQFSTVTMTWQKLPIMIKGRRNHTTVCTNTKLYVCGGEIKQGNSFTPVNSVERLDLHEQTWSSITSPNDIKLQPYSMGTLVADRTMYILGGYIRSNIGTQIGQLSRNAYRYDMASTEWVTIADIPEACDFGDSVAMYNENVYVFKCDKCMIYNSVANTWTTKTYTKLGKAISSAVIYNGGAHILAGPDGDNMQLHKYDIDNNQWDIIPDSPVVGGLGKINNADVVHCSFLSVRFPPI